MYNTSQSGKKNVTTAKVAEVNQTHSQTQIHSHQRLREVASRDLNPQHQGMCIYRELIESTEPLIWLPRYLLTHQEHVQDIESTEGNCPFKR